MAKISQVSAKYIINANIDIDGVVDRPDVIGAIFGQTEGLLGADLELRELQRSGRIGRIEVSFDIKGGKASGKIVVPSSLDKTETAIVAASLEIIQRIGPCNAKIKVVDIEDVRITKRGFVVDRAKELLKNMIDNIMPDSQELADEVAHSVRIMEIQEYGRDRLPAGPTVDESDEVIVVEGRADVLNLLKHGIKNVIALNGTSVPQTIIELSKKKVLTVFVDGDRGGNLIVKELLEVAEIDYITRAPDGKEVEEITKKEIHKALRSRITAEQMRFELGKFDESERLADNGRRYQHYSKVAIQNQPLSRQNTQPLQTRIIAKKVPLTIEEKKAFSTMLEDLIGTRGAYILDGKLNILGKVPITELGSTIKSLGNGVHAVVLDGVIDKNLLSVAEKTSIRYMVAMDAKTKLSNEKLEVLTITDF